MAPATVMACFKLHTKTLSHTLLENKCLEPKYKGKLKTAIAM